MDLRDKFVQNVLLGILVLLALIPVAWTRLNPDKPLVEKEQKSVAEKKDTSGKRKGIEAHAARQVTFEGTVGNRLEGHTKEHIAQGAPEVLNARYAELRPGEDVYHMNVMFRHELRCMEGDFDIIKREVLHARNPRLLLSVEPLGGSIGTFEPIVHEITADDLVAGLFFSFAIPRQERPQHLGVFLCLDSANSGRCSNKPVDNLSNVPLRYIKGARPKEDQDKPLPSARDRIYFFQYLLYDDGRVYGFDSLLDDEEYPKLDAYVSDRVQDAGVSSEVIARVRHLNTTLRSMPARITRHAIVVNLPRHDRAKCAEKGVTLPPALQRALRERGGTVTRVR